MRVMTGGAGPTAEGPLEKGVRSLEEKMEDRKKGLSQTLDNAAERIDRTGANVINMTSNWEKTAFTGVSNAIRTGSDYIEGFDISSRMERAENFIRRNPAQALLIGLGIGVLFGFIVRKR